MGRLRRIQHLIFVHGKFIYKNALPRKMQCSICTILLTHNLLHVFRDTENVVDFPRLTENKGLNKLKIVHFQHIRTVQTIL